MGQTQTYDLIVLGGGCSGLSVAERLSEFEAPPRTLIIEPRVGYENDRTWSFWAPREHRLTPLVNRHWSDSSYGLLGGKSYRMSHPDTPYQSIASLDFYAWAQRRIQRAAQIELSLGESVLETARLKDLWEITTTKRALLARCIIDTRPPPRSQTERSALFQCFIGQQVRLEQPLDDSQAELMTDMCADDHGFLFTYVLPNSQRSALIEVTRFAPEPIDCSILQADLDHLIDRRGWQISEVYSTEHASLPMGLPLTKPEGPVQDTQMRKTWAIGGTSAGALRPSSGYGFLRIQDWAHRCALSLKHHYYPINHPIDPWLQRWMDALFLKVISNNPQQAPKLFLSLYGGVPTKRLIRFMSDQASLADRIAVMASLPVKPFLSTLMK